MKQEEVDSVIITAEFTLKAEDEATKNITKEAEEETKQMKKRFAESTKNIIALKKPRKKPMEEEIGAKVEWRQQWKNREHPLLTFNVSVTNCDK